MIEKNSPVKDLVGYEVVLRRSFKAPRDLVFKAWTDPKHLAQWWGPGGFTNPRCEWDARPGGAIRIDMKGPNGVVYPMGGLCKEVVPPERLVFMSGPIDEKGKFLFEVLNTVTFEEKGTGTEVTVKAHVMTATPGTGQYLSGMKMGWTQSLERLAELTEGLASKTSGKKGN